MRFEVLGRRPDVGASSIKARAVNSAQDRAHQGQAHAERRFGHWAGVIAIALACPAVAALPQAGETVRGRAEERSPSLSRLADQIEQMSKAMCSRSGGSVSYLGDTSALGSLDKVDVDFRISDLRAATYKTGHALAGAGAGVCQIRILTLHTAIFEHFTNGQYVKVEADLDHKTGRRFRRATPYWLTEFGPARRQLLESQGYAFIGFGYHAGYRCAQLKKSAPVLEPTLCILDDVKADTRAQGLTLYGENGFGRLPGDVPNTFEVKSLLFGVQISDAELDIPPDLVIKDMP